MKYTLLLKSPCSVAWGAKFSRTVTKILFLFHIFVINKLFVFHKQVGQNSNSSSLECLCNHLTSFGGDFLVAPNTIDFDAVKRTMDKLDPNDMLVLATVSVVFLVYFLVLVAARRADKRDAAKVNTFACLLLATTGLSLFMPAIFDFSINYHELLNIYLSLANEKMDKFERECYL